ncbi:MAG: hypothetical protein ACO3G9_00520 [Chthoniobacterales bacterium]|jgi:hypothetical protein
MCFLAVCSVIFAGLAAGALVSRLLYAVFPRLTFAPWLDVVVSYFIWLPWVAGACLDGWRGLAAALLAQFVFLHAFCAFDRMVRGRGRKSLEAAHAKKLGWVRNEIALLLTVPAVTVFFLVRLAELLFYPPMALMAKMPRYKTSEWINLSRHKFDGLVGHDLVWCWYCDWMTGVWALGSEMLRNVESFWCPIRFCEDCKNCHVATDFPDVQKWCAAQGSIEDAVRVFEEQYGDRKENSWFGHPGRRKS